MVAPVVWYVGAGVAGLLGIGAVVEVVHKRNAAAANAKTVAGVAAANTQTGTGPGTPAATAAVAADPNAQAALAAAAAAAGGSAAQLATQAAATGQDPNQLLAAQLAANPGIDPAIAAAGVAASVAAAAQALASGATPGSVQMAQVTTNDPPPSGDLIIRSGPSTSAPQIGGAEKGGLVVVLDSTSVTADFTKISWPGGSRLPAAEGFAHTSALQLV